MAEIHIQIDGKWQSVTKDELFSMAKDGRIQAETLIRVGEKGSTAGKVAGIEFGDRQQAGATGESEIPKKEEPRTRAEQEVAKSRAAPIRINVRKKKPIAKTSDKNVSLAFKTVFYTVISIVALVAVPLIASWAFSVYSNMSEKKAENKRIKVIIGEAQKSVARNLKHPKDAEFLNNDEIHREHVVDKGKRKGCTEYQISGDVKAPNDLGANLTKSYTVFIIADKQGNTWTASVHFDGEIVEFNYYVNPPAIDEKTPIADWKKAPKKERSLHVNLLVHREIEMQERIGKDCDPSYEYDRIEHIFDSLSKDPSAKCTVGEAMEYWKKRESVK